MRAGKQKLDHNWIKKKEKKRFDGIENNLLVLNFYLCCHERAMGKESIAMPSTYFKVDWSAWAF